MTIQDLNDSFSRVSITSDSDDETKLPFASGLPLKFKTVLSEYRASKRKVDFELLKLCSARCPPPPMTASSFDSLSFQTYFSARPTLMEKVIKSFVPYPIVQEDEQFSEVAYCNLLHFIKTEKAKLVQYQTSKATCRSIEISKRFFHLFNYTHFKYGEKPHEIYPCNLYSCCKSLDVNAVAFPLYSFMSQHISSNTFKDYIEKIKDTSPCTKIVKHVNTYFKLAWGELSSDRYQTNATLSPSSIIKLSEWIAHFAMENDCICDLGSSYGSLIINITFCVNVLRPGLNVSGVGWEYALPRHIQGCWAMSRMLQDASDLEYGPIPSSDVRLYHRDILHFKTITNGSIVYAFDKVFDTALMIHILLMCINSKNVRLLISCKEANSKGTHKSALGSSAVQFKFGDLMKSLAHYFKKVDSINNLKMNISQEGCGRFYCYEVIRHESIGPDFFDVLYRDFFEHYGYDSNCLVGVKQTWHNAHDPPYTDRSTSLRSYYTKEGNIDLIKKKSRKKRPKM